MASTGSRRVCAPFRASEQQHAPNSATLAEYPWRPVCRLKPVPASPGHLQCACATQGGFKLGKLRGPKILCLANLDLPSLASQCLRRCLPTVPASLCPHFSAVAT